EKDEDADNDSRRDAHCRRVFPTGALLQSLASPTARERFIASPGQSAGQRGAPRSREIARAGLDHGRRDGLLAPPAEDALARTGDADLAEDCLLTLER